MVGEPDAGKPHVRFDEGVQETCDSVTRLCPTLPKPLTSLLAGTSVRAGAPCPDLSGPAATSPARTWAQPARFTSTRIALPVNVPRFGPLPLPSRLPIPNQQASV